MGEKAERDRTKSEALLWYRSGGKALIDARDKLARDSSNWMQYKLTRDRKAFSENLEEESSRKVEAALSAEERIAQLRKTTEEMLTHRTEYLQSTRELAMQAMREDEEAVKASRQSRKTMTVVEQAATTAA